MRVVNGDDDNSYDLPSVDLADLVSLGRLAEYDVDKCRDLSGKLKCSARGTISNKHIRWRETVKMVPATGEDATASRTLHVTYRLNGEIEHHDPIQPSTTACPLLPGQHLNVLEVPIQHEAETPDPSDYPPPLLDSSVFTLDPNAKYKSPKAPVYHNANPDSAHALSAALVCSMQPNSKTPGVGASISARPSTATGRPKDFEAPKTSQGLCLAFPTSASLKATIQKLRGSRSAPAVGEHASSSRRGPLKYLWRRSTEDEAERKQRYHDTSSRPLNTQTRVPYNSPDWDSPEWNSLHGPPVDAQPKYVAPWIADLPESQTSPGRTAHGDANRCSTRAAIFTTSLREDPAGGLHEHKAGSQSPLSRPAAQRPLLSSTEAASSHASSEYKVAARSVGDNRVGTASIANGSSHEANPPKSQERVNHCDPTARAPSPLILPIQSNLRPSEVLARPTTRVGHDIAIYRSTRPSSLLHNTRETLKTFYHTSPTLDGQLSPHYLSQPESPSVRDFEEAWDSDGQSRSASHCVPCENSPLFGEISTGDNCDLLPMPQLPSPEFQGYTLPETEHASTLTLRKSSSAVLTSKSDSAPSDTHQLVHSWNDGSDQLHLTALDGLIDDLGYLGQVII
ncbi:MAG: hypothetical protein Q9224_002605 [Gallowayella concinna]